MEIIIISNFVGNGGAARVISVLAAEFAKRGHKVSIIALSHYKGEEYQHIDNVMYIKFDIRYQKGVLHKIERIIKLRKEIKKSKDAVVISFEYFINMQTIVAMMGLHNKLIISERNDPSRVGGKFPIKQLRSILYRFADYLVCQTEDAMRYFPKSIQKMSTVIMNPIKNDLPEPWHADRRKLIVNFCRLEKQKNLQLLIDAFEEFHNFHTEYIMIIYGDGKERANLENYISSRRLSNSITLHPSVQNIHELIKDARMFVSSSNYEGLSNSMIEAMAIGIPTICTDCPVGGARMIIDDKINGLLVPVNNKKELTKAMINVADNDEMAKKLSKNSVLIKRSLSAQKIADQWEGLIRYR